MSQPLLVMGDVERLCAGLPRLTGLHTPRAVERLLSHWARDAHELAAVLRLCPECLYEPLEPQYLVLRALDALDHHGANLLTDLLTHHGPQGRAHAALLFALQPAAAHRALMQNAFAGESAAGQPFIHHLALARAEGRVHEATAEVHRALNLLAETWHGVRRPKSRVRSWPAEALADLAAARVHVAAVYRRAGADAALAVWRHMQGGQGITR
jgi:hypothetical protein